MEIFKTTYLLKLKAKLNIKYNDNVSGFLQCEGRDCTKPNDKVKYGVDLLLVYIHIQGYKSKRQI